jgi:hypothetical protein
MNKAKPTTHQFKGLQDWIEVFKAGTHTDSKGRTCTFTEGDLDQMVSNLALGAAPAVLGHPKHNDPAYGWVKPEGAKRVGEGDGASLFVKFSDVNPDFEKGVDSGAYRNRSVSVVKDAEAGWKLQHVGWLGAAAPAITGLQPLDYSANVDAYEFADQDDLDVAWAIGDMADLLRGLREQIIADKGIEAADAAIPSWRIQSVTDTAARLRQSALAEPGEEPALNNPSFSQHTPQEGAMSFTQADIDKAKADAKAEAEATATAQFAAKEAELNQLKAAQQGAAISAQINGWKAKGLVTPAEEPGLAEFMAAIEGDGAAEFSFTASDKSAAKKTPAQFFAEFMASRTPVVKLGNSIGGGGADADAVDPNNAAAVAEAAQSYMKAQLDKGLTVSLPEAVAHVSARAA